MLAGPIGILAEKIIQIMTVAVARSTQTAVTAPAL